MSKQIRYIDSNTGKEVALIVKEHEAEDKVAEIQRIHAAHAYIETKLPPMATDRRNVLRDLIMKIPDYQKYKLKTLFRKVSPAQNYEQFYGDVKILREKGLLEPEMSNEQRLEERLWIVKNSLSSIPLKRYKMIELYKLVKPRLGGMSFPVFNFSVKRLLAKRLIYPGLIKNRLSARKEVEAWIIRNLPRNRTTIEIFYERLKPPMTLTKFKEYVYYLIKKKQIPLDLISGGPRLKAYARQEEIMKNLWPGEIIGSGPLFKRINYKGTYKSFQRDIRDLAARKDIFIKEVFNFGVHTTLISTSRINMPDYPGLRRKKILDDITRPIIQKDLFKKVSPGVSYETFRKDLFFLINKGLIRRKKIGSVKLIWRVDHERS